MKPRRLKLEFYDNDGVKHSITIDGQVTREKVAKLLDLVEVMAGTPLASASALGLSPRKFDRLAGTIISQLRDGDFSSTDAKRAFESVFHEKIPLSTVATYLVRLVERGVLQRTETGQNMSYKVKSGEERSLLPLRS